MAIAAATLAKWAIPIALQMGHSWLQGRDVKKAQKKAEKENKRAQAMSNLINALSPSVRHQPYLQEAEYRPSGLTRALGAAKLGYGAYTGLKGAIAKEAMQKGAQELQDLAIGSAKRKAGQEVGQEYAAKAIRQAKAAGIKPGTEDWNRVTGVISRFGGDREGFGAGAMGALQEYEDTGLNRQALQAQIDAAGDVAAERARKAAAVEGSEWLSAAMPPGIDPDSEEWDQTKSWLTKFGEGKPGFRTGVTTELEAREAPFIARDLADAERERKKAEDEAERLAEENRAKEQARKLKEQNDERLRQTANAVLANPNVFRTTLDDKAKLEVTLYFQDAVNSLGDQIEEDKNLLLAQKELPSGDYYTPPGVAERLERNQQVLDELDRFTTDLTKTLPNAEQVKQVAGLQGAKRQIMHLEKIIVNELGPRLIGKMDAHWDDVFTTDEDRRLINQLDSLIEVAIQGIGTSVAGRMSEGDRKSFEVAIGDRAITYNGLLGRMDAMRDYLNGGRASWVDAFNAGEVVVPEFLLEDIPERVDIEGASPSNLALRQSIASKLVEYKQRGGLLR